MFLPHCGQVQYSIARVIDETAVLDYSENAIEGCK